MRTLYRREALTSATLALIFAVAAALYMGMLYLSVGAVPATPVSAQLLLVMSVSLFPAVVLAGMTLYQGYMCIYYVRCMYRCTYTNAWADTLTYVDTAPDLRYP